MTNPGPKILDVGCGTAKTPGAVGIDFFDLPGVDIVHNLNQFPWPLPNDSFDEVMILDVIEHLPDTIKVMEEIHRILKPSGIVNIRVVPWNHRYAFSDPTHVKYFSEHTFEFFTGAWRPYYTKARFEMLEIKYTYDISAQRKFRFKRLMRRLSYHLNNIVDGLHIRMAKLESENVKESDLDKKLREHRLKLNNFIADQNPSSFIYRNSLAIKESYLHRLQNSQDHIGVAQKLSLLIKLLSSIVRKPLRAPQVLTTLTLLLTERGLYKKHLLGSAQDLLKSAKS